MINNLLRKVVGSKNDRDVKRMRKQVAAKAVTTTTRLWMIREFPCSNLFAAH